MDLANIVSGVAGGGLTGFLAFIGSAKVAKASDRANARQTQLDSRRVSIDEFNTFKTAYHEERAEDREEIRRLRGLLRVAVDHVSSLRATMRRQHIQPPPLPGELVEITWGDFDRDTTTGP